MDSVEVIDGLAEERKKKILELVNWNDQFKVVISLYCGTLTGCWAISVPSRYSTSCVLVHLWPKEHFL